LTDRRERIPYGYAASTTISRWERLSRFRSTMTQANQLMEVLERINPVGMAVQILDSIPEEESELKNSTRAEIVALLLSAKAQL
jgi:hypothetical protein